MTCTKHSRVRYLLVFLLFSLLFGTVLSALIAWSIRAFRMPPADDTSASPSRPIIILDAGHGGEDGGAVGDHGVLEKDINLKITQTLNDMLRAAGYETVMTRTDDRMLYDPTTDYQGRKKRLDLEARLAIADSYENAVFVSIHLNAFPQSQYHGLQVYYSENDPDSARLAEQIQADAKSLLIPDNNRKIKPSNGTSYLLEHCSHPSILIECGFLSNPEECERLATESYQKSLATVFFCSLTNFLENENKTP